MENIHIGTSGWSYKEWTGILYPEHSRPADFLDLYSRQFNCAEINSCFYRIPKAKTVEHWAENTPKGFLFCAKMYRGISHFNKFQHSESLLQSYFEAFEPLQAKMGPVLIQLPKNFGFHADIAKAFFTLLDQKFGSMRFALESRHASWFADEALALLKKHRITHVISDVNPAYFPSFEAVTATDIYIRFHGRGKLYVSSYNVPELKEYAFKIQHWLKAHHHVWAFFNNTGSGFAVKNALLLKKLVEELNITP